MVADTYLRVFMTKMTEIEEMHFVSDVGLDPSAPVLTKLIAMSNALKHSAAVSHGCKSLL